ncbi:MAG: heme exporter protein CcmD [Alphaproteobacteria bacterium]|nr:MAG: heme exporter protein CcmD [Alphaproteobacteria bacterium]
MSEFFQMGGYALYVWPCYLLSALVLGGLAFQSFRSYRAAEDKVRQFERRGRGGEDGQ